MHDEPAIADTSRPVKRDPGQRGMPYKGGRYRESKVPADMSVEERIQHYAAIVENGGRLFEH